MVSMAPFTAYRDFANQQKNGYGGTGYSNAPSANDPEALLAYMTRQDATPNFGRKSLNEIKEVLKGMNLELGMDITSWPPENVEELARRLDEPF